jgi:hypothetical protein
MSGWIAVRSLTSLILLPFPPKLLLNFLYTPPHCTVTNRSPWPSLDPRACEVLLGEAPSARQASKLVQSLFETLAEDSTPPDTKKRRAAISRGMNRSIRSHEVT